MCDVVVLDGLCAASPSQIARAAKELGCPDDHRKVWRYLTRWLPAKGLLEVVHRGKRKLANRYQVGAWIDAQEKRLGKWVDTTQEKHK